jgi:hypothetical protein
VLELAANEQRHVHMSAALPPLPLPSPPHAQRTHGQHERGQGGTGTHKFSSSNLAP